jgi:hypothetical protein
MSSKQKDINEMKILNTPHTAIELQAGLYRIIDVVYFKDTSRFPVALVSYKRNVSYKATKDLAFYVCLKALYNCSISAIADPSMLPDNLKNKTIHVKRLSEVPVLDNDKFSLIPEAQWEVLDIFKMYDLYKQQGEGLLAISAAEWNEYGELDKLLSAEDGEDLYDEVEE